MSGFLDTNVVVRYFVGVPEDLAQQARRIVDSDSDLYITDVVLTEAMYVMRWTYGLERDLIVNQLIEFIQRRNITMYGISKWLVIQGLLKCLPSGRVSIVDAMIWASARESDSSVVYSFDQRFPSDGLEVLRDLP